jgi:amidophosphoribosyltransferase
MLREAGAREVHIRISSPPVRWPCFYGIDFATRAELIANGTPIAEITRRLGADSLAYVSLDGLIAASRQPAGALCRACFDGVYPVELPDAERLGKFLLEGGAESAGVAAVTAVDQEALEEAVALGMNGADPSPDDLGLDPEDLNPARLKPAGALSAADAAR